MTTEESEPPRRRPEAPESFPSTPVRRPRRTSEHALLIGAHEHFESAKVSDAGYLRPAKRKLIDLFVSKETLDRALALANAVFTALESRGHRVMLAPFDQRLGRPAVDERSRGGQERYGYGTGGPDRPTIVYVGTVALGLTIYELSEEMEVQYVDGTYIPVSALTPLQRRALLTQYTWTSKRDLPTGKLCLRASSPYSLASWEQQWRETRKGELSAKIPDIVVELESAATTVAMLVAEGERRAEEQRREWELQHQKWLRDQEERRRAQNVRDSEKELTDIVESWGEAKRIEAFFEDAERRASTLPSEERAVVLGRLTLARELIGGVDALQRLLHWKAPEER